MRSRYAMAMGTAFVSCVLTACGGGGSGGGSNDQVAANATPSTAFSTPVNVSTTPSHFSAVWRIPGPGAPTDTALTIIDTDTQRVVRTYDTYMWRTSIRVQHMPGSRQQISLGAGHVYMILNGQVLQLDLSGTSLGAARRISSITQACALGGPMISVDIDGRHDWLRVITAGPSGDCANRTDARSFLVASDMSETEVGPEVSSTSGPIMLSALPNAQGASTGLLVMEAATGGLAVYSIDMKTRRYTVADKLLAKGNTVELPIAAPDVDQKAYLHAADKLYLLDWQSGKVVLGAPLRQLDTPDLPLHYTADNNFLYFLQGGAIYRAGSDRTVRLLSTTDAQLGSVDELTNTENSICINQTADIMGSSSWSSTYSITSIDKSSGTARTLISSSPDPLYPVATSGQELLLLKLVKDGTGYKTHVLSLNMADASTQLQGTNVTLVGLLPPPTWQGAAVPPPQTLLWAEDIADQPYVNLPARRLKAYSPGQPAPVVLGTLGPDNAAYGEINLVSWQSARPIIATSDISGDQHRFWLLQADQSYSLAPVLTLP